MNKGLLQPTALRPLTDAHLCFILQSIDKETKRLPPGFKQIARAIEAAHNIAQPAPELERYIAANYPDARGETITARVIDALQTMDIALGMRQIAQTVQTKREKTSLHEYKGPARFTPEETANGGCAIRWVTSESVCGRPNLHDVLGYIAQMGEELFCKCERCQSFIFSNCINPNAQPVPGAPV